MIIFFSFFFFLDLKKNMYHQITLSMTCDSYGVMTVMSRTLGTTAKQK